jgi:autotransporter-associated beta strand protein
MGSGLMTRMSVLSPAMAVNTGCFEAIGFASLPYLRNPYPNPAIILPKPMKPLGHLIVSSIGLAASAVSLSAQSTLYWDGTDTTADANGGGGTWDSGIASNWDLAATAGSASVWPGTSSGADHAVFGGVAGTVTIAAGGVTTNDITFSTAGYTISGGPLTLDGTTPTITNGGSASILSNISGTAGLTKSGNGTLTLGGNNSGLSGALVIRDATSGNNGGVVISGSNAMGAISSVDIQNNSFLRLDNATVASTVAITVAGGGGTSAPEGAIRGTSGNSVVNASIAIGNGSVRVGNTGTSTTFGGAITATAGSGYGLLIRKASAQGVIFTNTGNYWEGVTQLHDGSHYFHPGTLPTASNLQMAASTSTWFETNGTFTRAVGTGANQVQFNSNSGRINGFSARGGNLTVNLGGAAATLTWGTAGFTPAILGLSGPNSTGTVTLANPINLGAATRIVDVSDGTAAMDAIMSGAISNGTLQVQGAGNLTLSGDNTLATITKGAATTDTGTLVLSGSNTFSTSTLTFGTASQNRGAIRLENSNALGGVTLINGSSGTGGAQARIELANGVTISGVEYRAGGRTSATTTGASIVNISGNNTWGGTITITNTGGSYGIRSDAGRLTISGTLRNGIAQTRNWELAGAGNILISGAVINGSGAGALTLTKAGGGTLEMTGNSNTYSGGTVLSAGTLLVNNTTGSGLGSGAVTVNGGTLGGNGSFSGAVTVNTTGEISPGASIGTLATGALLLNTGSTFSYEINTTAMVGDLLNVDGNLDLDGTVSLDLVDLGTASLLTAGTKFTLISYAGSWTAGDVFDGYADDSMFTFAGNEWLINYNDMTAGSVNGGAFANGVTLTVVPEPACSLLGLAAMSLMLRRRR